MPKERAGSGHGFLSMFFFQVLAIWNEGQTGGGRCRLVVLLLS